MWTASKLSRHCAHSNILSELHPKPSRDKAAAKGTAFHECLGIWQRQGIVPFADEDDVNAWLKIMVDNGWAWPDGCELEVAWGLDKWGHFCPVMENPPGSHKYEAIDGITDLLTAGRADACWIAGDVLISCDWKSGRTMSEHPRTNLQVNAAGIALAQKWKTPVFQPVIYYAQRGLWVLGDEVGIGSDTYQAVIADIKAAAALDADPHPGPHCSDCWERKNCAEAA